METTPTSPNQPSEQKHTLKNILTTLLSVVIIAGGLYFKVTDRAGRSQMRDIIETQEQAEEFYQAGEYEASIAEYEKIITKGDLLSDEDMNVFYHNMSLSYGALDNMDKSIEMMKMSLKYAPKDSVGYLESEASIALLENDIDKGMEIFHDILSKDENSFVANNELGMIYYGLYSEDYTDYEKALPFNQKAIELNPNDINMKHNLGMNYYFLNEMRSAQKYLEEYYASGPAHAENLFVLGMIYTINENPKADEFFQKAIALDPEYEAFMEEFLAS